MLSLYERFSPMKKTLKVGLLLFGLCLPVWANSPDWNDDRHKKQPEAVPEGGNCAAYTIVPGAAILGSLLLVRKQRATKTLVAEAKFNAGTSEAHQIRAKIPSRKIGGPPLPCRPLP
jgi:hypothetical protein